MIKKTLLAILIFMSATLRADNCDFYHLGIPKSGTHLLKKILSILNNGKPVNGEYPHPDNFQREINFFKKHKNKTFIFLIRDPRDVLLSAYEYSKDGPIEHDKNPGKFNYWHLPLRRNPRYLEMTDEERMVEMILMSKENLLIGSERIYAGYRIAMHAAANFPNVEIFYFEDLIGPKGGGDEEAQRESITRLAKLTGLPLENVDLAMEKAWGGENQLGHRTFRHGLIGRWNEAFDSQMRAAFKTHHQWNSYLLHFGFETNPEW